MLVIFESKKEVVKEIIKHTKGGRGSLAGAIGMSETTFNNKLYERNGCRFFDDEDLEAMDIHAGTYFLAEYRANLRGGLFIPLPSVEVDEQELSEILMREVAAIGDANINVSHALNDGKIDAQEEKQIMAATVRAAAKLIKSKLATIQVYKAG